MQFGIDEAREGERVVLTVRGEIDMATAPRLRAALERAAGAAGGAVDLRAVEFMDSTGLSALVAAHQALARLVIVCPPGPGRRALEVSGLMSLLEIVGLSCELLLGGLEDRDAAAVAALVVADGAGELGVGGRGSPAWRRSS